MYHNCYELSCQTTVHNHDLAETTVYPSHKVCSLAELVLVQADHDPPHFFFFISHADKYVNNDSSQLHASAWGQVAYPSG